MTALPPHLLELEELLLQLPEDSEALLLSGVDGVLAAVALGPDPIPVEEWLPIVADGHDPAESLDAPALAKLNALLLRHAADVRAALAHDLFEPIYVFTDDTDEIAWEPWMDGFHRGLTARGDAWAALSQDDDPAVAAMFDDLGQLAMAAVDPAFNDYDPELIEDAANIIPSLVAALHDLRADRIGPLLARAVPIRGTKTGRNDACPCGSGKKYKKCCGVQG